MDTESDFCSSSVEVLPSVVTERYEGGVFSKHVQLEVGFRK